MNDLMERSPGRELVPTRSLAYGRINWSRVIVDCPNPLCRSALKLPYGFPAFTCWDCGATAPVIWPDNIADIVSLLLLRPRL